MLAHRRHALAVLVRVRVCRLMAYELLSGVRVLPLGEAAVVRLVDLAVQSPSVRELAMPVP